jgi:Leucine rich repeat
MRVTNMNTVQIRCEAKVTDIGAVLPMLDDKILKGDVFVEIRGYCPCPQKFSVITTKIRSIWYFKYAYGDLSKSTFDMFDQQHNLSKLELMSDRIAYIKPDAFSNLHNLTRIDLSYNRIKLVPAESFQNNFYLQHIRLAHNDGIKFESGCFANRTFLKTIALSNNKLSIFPDDIFTGSHNLVQLGLAGNNISTFNK